MLDFRIESFLAVCEEMSYSKAADKRHVTQPCITQHIKALEKYYEVHLFDYQNRQLTITPEGQMLLEKLQTMKHDIHQLKREIKALGASGQHYKMGATRTIGDYYLPSKLSQWLEEHPSSSIEVNISNTSELMTLLSNGEIDFALVEGYFDASKYDAIHVANEPFIGVCGAHFEYGNMEAFTDLLTYPLLLREAGSGTREILERYLHFKGIDLGAFQQIHKASSIPLIKGLMQNNQGISFMYEVAVQEEIRQGKLQKIQIPDFDIWHHFSFIWRKDSTYKTFYEKLCHDMFSHLEVK